MKASLFDDEPEQLTLAGSPRKPSPAKKPRAVRPVVPLKDFEDWLEFAESVLGHEDIPADSLVAVFKHLSELSEYEDQLPIYMGMDPFYRLSERFPWLDTMADIATQQGFFHWELQFAQVFANGGFDIQVGNPPWVRPEWDESGVLAELEPWFKLSPKPAPEERRKRISGLLSKQGAQQVVLEERSVQAGMSGFLGSIETYPLLSGTRVDFYRAFMIRTWSSANRCGSIGLLHPDTHFTGEREQLLRAETYSRLRIHGDFVNPGHRFFPEPVGESKSFRRPYIRTT